MLHSRLYIALKNGILFAFIGILFGLIVGLYFTPYIYIELGIKLPSALYILLVLSIIIVSPTLLEYYLSNKDLEKLRLKEVR